MVRGTPKFTGLALADGSFTFLSATIGLRAKAAFVDLSTGKTHGFTIETQAGWSKETFEALGRLRECIERDLAHAHLVGVEESSALPGTSSPGAPRGLGEHLEPDDGVPSV